MSEPKRPNCPRCGGNRIVSNGSCWKCKDCKRLFVKNPKPRRKPQKKTYVMQNPVKVECVACGEEHVIDNPNSEVGLFYCRECLKKHGGKSVSSRLRDSGYKVMIGVPELGVK